MNFLAHAYLSPDDPYVQIGNLLGDTVKGRKMTGVAPKVREGVLLHRRIDLYTDSHAQVLDMIELFRPILGRFSAIAVDVIMDHYLAKNWKRYAEIDLEQFVTILFNSFSKMEAILPEKTRWLGGLMRDRGWLLAYSTMDGLEGILSQMSRRLENRVKLFEAIPCLVENYEFIGQKFEKFFSDLECDFPPGWKTSNRFTSVC